MSNTQAEAERVVDALYMSWLIQGTGSDRHRKVVDLVARAIEAEHTNCGRLGGSLSDAVFAVCGDRESA